MAGKEIDSHSGAKRSRDLVAIRDLFSVFPRPLVDQVLGEALSDRVLVDHIDCLTATEDIFRSTLFHLYDRTLLQLLDDFFRHWDMAWDVGRRSHHDPLHRRVATLSLCDTDPPDRWREHDNYIDHVQQAQRAMMGLTRHLHEEYPDFDLALSDREATRKYWEMVEQVKKQMEEIFGWSGSGTKQDSETPGASDEGGFKDASRDATVTPARFRRPCSLYQKLSWSSRPDGGHFMAGSTRSASTFPSPWAGCSVDRSG